MGRYPLRAAVNDYLDKRKLIVRASTLANERRILNHLAGVVEDLARRKRVGSANPRKIGMADVRAIVDALEARGLEPETKIKYLQYLEGVLKSCGNKVFEEMRDAGAVFPRRQRKPIKALSEDELKAVQASAAELKGWVGARARFLTIVYPATGLRPSELRLAHIEDLDTKNWELTVRHPKGEGTYGTKRKAKVLPQYREQVLAYLEEREAYLHGHGRRSHRYLIPNCDCPMDRKDQKGRKGQKDEDAPYSSNTFRKLKKSVQDLSGVRFKLKDFRSTYATLTVGIDPNLLPDVSAMLGHSDLKTTQRYYAQISCSDAGKRIEEAWMRRMQGEKDKSVPGESTSLGTKRVLIERREYLPGYG